ncbi:hypothetical protein PPTG_14141 [Phytophthora nicotianae INRA-310]|uniref:Uncharacterized protein n=1 Tax=Phytophthora nicotianae (strain INRA-310) TaxID=761204 RepID=W2PXP4_PHYN3|nr:hypothetical protein PPTG_14141 [Phytophthora nicotianae INRA-310]ETN05401.1 hypothetical protein PPTG_14141 [Phytophthora nicotianae INRA-310]
MKMRLARGNIKESSGLHKKEEALHKTFIKELQVSRKITKQIVEKGSDAKDSDISSSGLKVIETLDKISEPRVLPATVPQLDP